MKEVIKREFYGWKAMEILWLAAATSVILLLSILWKDSAVGVICALTGIWCVILTGKGKLSSFLFGTVNTLLYAWVSFRARFYGEVMLNLLYYFPTNIIGLIAWKNHFDEETGEVAKKRMSLGKSVLVCGGAVAGTVLYGLVLKILGGSLPFADSMSTVVSVIAQVLCIRRYREQWLLWIVVNTVTVIMWAVDYANGGENISTLVMWGIYLINAVMMYVKWSEGAEKI